jgi:sphingosine kinase
MKIDLFSMLQNGKRTLSFMSQALGLMADLDLGTENLRWMGDTRFMVGFLRGGMAQFINHLSGFSLMFLEVISFKPCPIQLSIKVAERDKHVMAEALWAQPGNEGEEKQSSPSNAEEPIDNTLSLPKPSGGEEDDWIVFDKPILYLYAGQGPYVGRFVNLYLHLRYH